MGEAVVVKRVIGRWRLCIPKTLHPRPRSLLSLRSGLWVMPGAYPLPAPELDHSIAYAHVIARLRERRRTRYRFAVAHPEA
jgi:hypothetical protein